MNGFCSLASGSKGNALYFGTEKTKVLIDAGLSLKTIKAKLENLNVSIDSIDAILITHEHSDHIKGLEQLVKQYDIPIIANHETARAICQMIPLKPRFKIFSTGEKFTFGDIDFKSFSIQHDTIDPVGFLIQSGQFKLGLCTDLGCVTSHVIQSLKGLDYLFIESNHNIDMVHASSRPDVYKQRVLSRLGHLCNEDAAKVIEHVYHEGLKRVFLAHLSEECNNPTVAYETVKNYLNEKNIELKLSIAYQETGSESILF